LVNESEKIRVFMALPIPPDTCSWIGRITGEILKKRDGLKIVKPDNFHLTLAFIGDVPSDILPFIDEPLKNFALSFNRFDVRFGKVGTFPGVIFLKTIRGEEKLVDLTTAVRAILRRHNIPYDNKQFKGHLTLARTKDRKLNPRDFIAENALEKTWDYGFTASEFVLLKSDLKPEGPTYTRVSTYNLGNGGQ